MSPPKLTVEKRTMPDEIPPGSRLRVRLLELHSGMLEVFLHPDDATLLALHPLDRVRVEHPGEGDAPATVNLARTMVSPGEVGVSVELARRLEVGEGGEVTVRPAPRPRSVEFIKAKLDGRRLSPDDVRLVIRDIARGDLTAIELTAWACGVQVHGMDLDETVACINAMVETGERIRFDRGPVVDVHSIGGVPGNKYAPIAVSIVAENGLMIPKTSSRAISSACGTADFMEVVTPVALSAEQIKRITEDVGGTLCWGGGVSLAPADDEIIRVEYPLSLDPPSQLLASVLSKKVSVGATEVLIDIPLGPGAKMKDEMSARHLARDFITVGERVGLNIQCLLSQGSQPMGRTIGPVLEVREAMQVLEGSKEPADLVDKACTVAGRLLEMGQVVPPGKGYARALRTLESGKALSRFQKIIAAQGGNPELKSTDLQPGLHTADLHAPQDGLVGGVDIKGLVQVARAAGSPRDKGAGLMLNVRPGDTVKADQVLYTIYADNADRLRDAVGLARKLRPFRLEGRGVFGFIE